MIHLSSAAEIRRPSAHSSTFQQLLQEISLAWQHQPLLLLVGESGTGKTHLARQLLDNSGAFKHRLLEINCRCEPLLLQKLLDSSSISSESENDLAVGPPSPRVILLQEIDALTITQQQRLLKQLEHLNRFSQLPQDRWILTTRVDLRRAVSEEKFRDDLYYRISMFRYEFPPLRQNYAEILWHTRQFVRLYTARYAKKIERIEENFLRAVFDYPWPGNIRELQHVIERAVIYCHQESLTSHHLPEDIRNHSTPAAPPVSLRISHPETVASESSQESDQLVEETLESRVNEAEREQIEQALKRNLQSRTRAARELGISRVTLYNKMKKLGLDTRKTYNN